MMFLMSGNATAAGGAGRAPRRRARPVRGEHHGGILHPRQFRQPGFDFGALRLQRRRVLTPDRQRYLHQPAFDMHAFQHFSEIEGGQGRPNIIFCHRQFLTSGTLLRYCAVQRRFIR
jgi:hypothetical protein